MLTDGKSYKILPVAKDYKRIGENDTGLNTGGMGAVSPPPFVTKKMMREVEQKIIKPTLMGLQERKIPYYGFLFLGLIRVGNEPFMIEYNCRLGDPETEVVIPRLKNDLVNLFQKTASGMLDEVNIRISRQVAATVIMASAGYPGEYEKGKLISELEKVEGSMVFHAGTKRSGNSIVTNGGRVLAVTSIGADFKSALDLSNRNAHRIAFDGKYFRSDIGFDL